MDDLWLYQMELARAQRATADAQVRVADAQERVFSCRFNGVLDCAITEADTRLEECLDQLAAAMRHEEYARRQLVRQHAENHEVMA